LSQFLHSRTFCLVVSNIQFTLQNTQIISTLKETQQSNIITNNFLNWSFYTSPVCSLNDIGILRRTQPDLEHAVGSNHALVTFYNHNLLLTLMLIADIFIWIA